MLWFSLSGSNIFEQSLGKITMTTLSLREQLRLQIESLPDDLLTEVADFTAFILKRRQSTRTYADWNSKDWADFSLAQFFRETDNDVTYSLEDAQEVFPR